MTVLRAVLFLAAACSAKHIMVEDADMIRGVMVEDANRTFREGGGKCEGGYEGIALISILMRYPTGWVSQYDVVVGALHGLIEDFVDKSFNMKIVPQLEKPITCSTKKDVAADLFNGNLFNGKIFDNSARMNILTLRVCGATQPELFCQCTLGIPRDGYINAKYHACEKGISHVETVLSVFPSIYDSIAERAEPLVEAAIAKAAMAHGYFDGEKGQDIIALEFLHPEQMEEWSTEESACKAARALIGDGENNLGQTDKEKHWAEVREQYKQEAKEEKDAGAEAVAAAEAEKSELPEICKAQEQVDLQAAATQALYGAFNNAEVFRR